MIAPEEQ
jgi:hypothetical protein